MNPDVQPLRQLAAQITPDMLVVPPDGCMFLADDEQPCTAEVMGVRVLTGVVLAACSTHEQSGGFLHPAAKAYHVDTIAYRREYHVAELRAKEFPDG